VRILVINGPNINMLGIREPDIYGRATYDDLVGYIRDAAAKRNVSVSFFQSNHEGAIVDAIQDAYGKYDGIVMNPAAYTHTSVAILDAVKAVGLPCVEVHISDVTQREDFRQRSFVRSACVATIMGRGFDGYVDGLDVLIGGADAAAKIKAEGGLTSKSAGAAGEQDSEACMVK
jgi:3-dehydroquinate dehydratase, type II